MSRCRYSKLIKRYFSEDLTFGDLLKLKEHVESCPICGAEYAALNGIFETLERSNVTAKKAEVSFDFTRATLARLNEKPKGEITARTPVVHTPSFRWAMGFAVAFLVLTSINTILKTINNTGKPESIAVSFQIYLPNAQTVSLAGDFNSWDYTKTSLKKQSNGSWKISLNLKPGQYQYMFVVDGTKWQPDPQAKESVNDGYGSRNSIVDLL